LVAGDARRSRLQPEMADFLMAELDMQKVTFLHQMTEVPSTERKEKGERV
jgi:hypothetical protein